MPTTPEGKVKKMIVTELKRMGIYYFFPVTAGFGRSGVPDIVCCVNGHFVAIECKSGQNKPTALQQRELDRIHEAGGYAYVANEETAPNVLDNIWNLME